jgi:hypothetical protein
VGTHLCHFLEGLAIAAAWGLLAGLVLICGLTRG